MNYIDGKMIFYVAILLFLQVLIFPSNASHRENWNHQHANVPPTSNPHSHHPQSAPAGSQQSFVPVMRDDHVALSLRLTCELNQRLRRETFGIRQPEIFGALESFHIPFSSATSQPSEPVTVFHTSSSSSATEKSLESDKFVRQLTNDVLQLKSQEEKSLVLSLAIIYLDRATSVETLRSNGAPPCPFCTFQTVRRLFLASILTAVEAVGGNPIEYYYQRMQPILSHDDNSISLPEILEMMTWMKYALGDSGFFVGAEEMQKFKHLWEHAFRNTNGGHPGPNNPSGNAPLRVQDQDSSLTSTSSNTVDKRAPSGFYPINEENAETQPQMQMQTTVPSQPTDDSNPNRQQQAQESFHQPSGFYAQPAFTHSHKVPSS